MVDDTQAERGISTFKNNLTQLGASTTMAQGKLAAFNAQLKQQATSFTAGVAPIKQQGNALANYNQSLAANVVQTKSSISVLKDHVLGMGFAVSGIIGLVGSYTSLEKAMVMNEKVSLMAEKARDRVTKIQNALNKMVDKGKQGTVDYNIKLKDLKVAQEQAGIMTERAGIIQQQTNERMAEFATQIIPSVIMAGSGLFDVLQGIGGEKGLGGLATKFKGLGTGIMGLGGRFKEIGSSIAGTVMPALSNLMGTKGLDGLNNKFKETGKSATGFWSGVGGTAVAGGLGAVGAVVIIQQIQAVQDAFDAAGIKFEKMKAGLAFSPKEAQLGFEQLDELMKATGMSAVQLGEDMEGAKAKFVAAGGKLSSTGDIIWGSFNKAVEASNKLSEAEKKLSDDTAKLTKLEQERQTTPVKAQEAALNITIAQDKADIARLKTIGETNKALADNTAQWALQAKAFEGNTTSINLATKAYLDVHNAIVATNPDIQKNIEKTRLQKQETDAVAKALINVPYDASAEFVRLFGDANVIAAAGQDEFRKKLDESNIGMTGFEGAIQAGVTQFQTLFDTTANNVIQQKTYREQLIASVGPSVGFAKAAAMTTAELELNQTAMQGNLESMDALAHSTTDTSHAINEQLVALLESKAVSIDYTQALTDADMAQRLMAQGFEAGRSQAKDFFDNLVKTTEQETSFTVSLAEGASELGIHGSLLAFSSGKMQELIKTTYEQTTAFDALQMQTASSTEILKDQTLIMAQVNAGMVDGTVAANDWAISNVKATAEGFAFHDQLVKITADMLGLPVPINATDEALKKAQTTFNETLDAGLAMSEMMTDNLEPAFQRVSKIFQAKSFKDMKKALKDLELPKGFTHGLDDAFKGSQKAAESARKVGTAMDILVTKGVNFSKSDLTKNMKAFGNELDRLSKVKGTTTEIDKLLASLKTMTPEQLGAHSKSMQFLVDTINEFGFLPKDKAKEFFDMFNKESVKVGPSATTAAAGINTLTAAMEKNLKITKEGKKLGFGKIGASAGAQIGTGAKLSAGAEIDVNKIDQKTVMTLDNHQALAAVDVVAKRIASLSGIHPAIAVNNQPAIKAVDVVANRIASLSGINPAIPVNNKPAIKAIDVVAKRIDSLSGINPPIPVNNKPAIKAVDVIAKRIDSLSKINPDINVNNKSAIKAVDVVAKRIQGLENIHPVINVKVNVQGMPKGAAHGMHETLTEDTLIQAHKGERVDIMRSNLGDTSMRSLGASGNSPPPTGGGMGMGNMTVNNYIDLGGDTIVRSFKRKLGTNLYTMGR